MILLLLAHFDLCKILLKGVIRLVDWWMSCWFCPCSNSEATLSPHHQPTTEKTAPTVTLVTQWGTVSSSLLSPADRHRHSATPPRSPTGLCPAPPPSLSLCPAPAGPTPTRPSSSSSLTTAGRSAPSPSPAPPLLLSPRASGSRRSAPGRAAARPGTGRLRLRPPARPPPSATPSP